MDASLPRRPILGVELSGFDRRGMLVRRARPGSMGEEANLLPGDIVCAIGKRPVRSLEELRAALRALVDVAEIEVERDGARIVRVVPVSRRAREPGVGYETVDGRLRALVTEPVAVPPKRCAAVLLISGISLTSVEDFAPFTELVRSLPDFVTMRLEKRGVGDSEGEPPDFEDEVLDCRAGLAWLRAHPLVDSTAVCAVGHSVGGMIAPLLAASLAAVAVYGTSAQRWLACLDASARRQALLRGLRGADVEAMVEDQRARIARDDDERSLRFHAQLDATDLSGAWQDVDAPVLVQHGEYDWVVERAEAEGIVASTRAGRLVEMPGLDHAMTRHASLRDSLASFGRGELDRSVGDTIASFFRVVCGRAPP